MKLLLVVLLVAAAYAEEIENPAYGYLERYGIPQAQRIREAEEAFHSSPESRIVGGSPAALGQYPYQAGLLIDLIGIENQSLCGAVLVSEQRLLTAAHCWNDGVHQAWRFTVVLGSIQLFFGGSRIQTSVAVPHSGWLPDLIRNDIAVIYLPSPVEISSTIAPIALPSGSQLNEDFAGEAAITTGFGRTIDGGSITTNQFLSHVNLNIMTNSDCFNDYPLLIQPSSICTLGLGGVGHCDGDSGGPLIVTRNGNPLLVGITSFGSTLGCQANLPSAYARVTSFIDFIDQHLNTV